MKVVFLPDVFEYFENLARILHEKGYFGFRDAARKYVDELVKDIKINLPIKQTKPAPKYFSRYGKDMEYAGFRKNKHTTWYVFFRVYIKDKEEVYQIRYISNNHVIAHHL